MSNKSRRNSPKASDQLASPPEPNPFTPAQLLSDTLGGDDEGGQRHAGW